MKTATKNYAEQTDYASLINAGGNAAGTNTYAGDGTKTSTIIIVVAVLIVAVVGVVLFTRK